jgi:hypothetical protein
MYGSRSTASAAPRPAAVVVGPDDLVEEALTTEELVQEHLRVVGLAVVEMEVERPRRRQHPPELAKARLEKAEIVVERVLVRRVAERGRGVAPPAEADAVAVVVRRGRERQPPLPASGVEGGIGVDELEARVVEARKELEVVPEEDEILAGPHGARV